ncbi:uncharacterized protein ACA1_275520 [Acanthamoeba castellanii str. Neff]|uniref:Uncharacterized protein n=1 Tax=Acanthamoeba castellanii (strain ATCC 30010 / Neff) TaxID=1257118 RepID=L8GRX1_ACACF|nr:uncharacterized protein ACA1_275520 [Acanthamoeba castellanii str. Neff]ELR15378.1 hypothetical protein ACA1_275520 [Acanthamoeba castellanii str. Neff]
MPAAIALRATRDNLRHDSAAAESEADADEAFGAANRKLLDDYWHRDYRAMMEGPQATTTDE